MSVCRICLCINPRKDISLLQCQENDDHNGEYILLLCLGIQIIQQPRDSTKFCTKCFKKIVEFYQFKSLALRNEAILRSLGIKEFLKDAIKKEVLCLPETFIDVSELQDYKQEADTHESSFECVETQEDESEYDNEPPIECIVSQDHTFDVPVKINYEEELQADVKTQGTQKKQQFACKALPERKRPFGCDKCDFKFISKYHLRRHLETHKSINEQVSDQCGLIQDQESTSINALRERKKSFSCDDCELKFTTKYHLMRHFESHKPLNERTKVICDHCDKAFFNKDILRKHIWTVHLQIEKQPSSWNNKERYKCELCDSTFAQRVSLWKHMKTIHYGVKPQCPVCKKHFSEEYLTTHIKTKHKPESRVFKCNICNYGFTTQTLLRRHASVHSDEKPYACEICGTRFRLKYSVALHRRQVHEQLKNHVCHICSTRFVTNSRLQKHIKRHAPNTEDVDRKVVVDKNNMLKQFICPDCGKPLASAKTLKHHRELHTGLKKYNCKLCNAIFASKKYVHAHMRTHYQDRKFACKFCPAAFVRSGARRRHELEIHLEPGKKPVKKYKRKTPRASRAKKKLQPEIPQSYPVILESTSEALVEIEPLDGPFKAEVDVLDND